MKNANIKPLPNPARYRPFNTGNYNTKPNLFRLGMDLGNDFHDDKVLQIDSQFDEYRQAKIYAREINIEKYTCENLLQKEDANCINRFLAETACSEYPEYFQIRNAQTTWHLECTLSGETLVFEKNSHYLETRAASDSNIPSYTSGLDALASQFQEDICILKTNEESGVLVAAHLCFPNRWSVNSKIGKSFVQIHDPVAGFSRSNPNSEKLLNAMLNSGPYVRFAWGLSNDATLDHHPDQVQDFYFNETEESLYLRTERQVLLGIPERNIILFFIRTYYEDIHTLLKTDGLPSKLVHALNSIDDDLLRYKGLSGYRDSIVHWIKSHS